MRKSNVLFYRLKQKFPPNVSLKTKIMSTILLAIVAIIAVRDLIAYGQLVYGDIPLYNVGQSKTNFMFVWADQQLGTNVRQGFNTFRDFVISSVAINSYVFYFIKYTLPLILIPVNFYWFLTKLNIKNEASKIIASLTIFMSPVVFGDLITGQTMWVYLAVPWAIYFLFKLIYVADITFKNAILLGLSVFLCFGMLPPIIVPLAVLLTFLLVTGIIMNKESLRGKKMKLLQMLSVAAVVFIVTTAPYIAIGAAGKESYTPPTLMGDYLNNYSATQLDNTLRLSGNNGNGQKTLNYNQPEYINNFGYALLIIIVLGLYGSKWNLSKTEKILVFNLLLTILLVLGFMHLMSVSPSFGAGVFENSWLAATVRNPTKIYVILMCFYAILIAISLGAMSKSNILNKANILIPSFFVVCLLAYGWPVIRGDMGLFYGEDKSVKNYMPNAALVEIASDANSRDGRSMLLPASHADELNYEYAAPSMNTFKLEGGLKKSSEYLLAVKAMLNEKNPYFFNFLRAASVNNIYVSKNSADYSAGQFSLFTSTNRYADIKAFFEQNGVSVTKEFEEYSLFTIDSAKTVYVPDKTVLVKNSNKLKNIAPFLDKNTAVVEDEDLMSLSDEVYSNNTHESLTDVKPGTNGLVQVYDPNLVPVRLMYDDVRRRINIHQINLLSKSNDKEVLLKQSEADVVKFGDKYVDLKTLNSEFVTRAGIQNLELFDLRRIEDFRNGSFEMGAPKAGNATPSMSKKQDIYAKLHNNEYVAGSKSLLLGSNSGTAFIQLPLPNVSANERMISLSHKNLKGASIKYAILQDEEVIASSDSRLNFTENEWNDVKIFYKTKAGALNPPILYIYVESDVGGSENLIDDIQDYELITLETLQTVVAQNPHQIAYNNNLNPRIHNDNDSLLNNGNFENGMQDWTSGDATISKPGKHKLKVNTVRAENNRDVLQLESSNHTAYAAQKLKSSNANTIYELSFDYRNVKGDPAAFAVWQSGVETAALKGNLKKSKEWNSFKQTFVPDAGSTNISLYIYSPAKFNDSINQIDNVSLKVVPFVSDVLIKEKEELRKRSSFEVGGVDKINPAFYKVNLHNPELGGTIIFNQSFSSDWKIYKIKKGERVNSYASVFQNGLDKNLGVTSHFRANGYSNGWHIQPNVLKGHDIIIAYHPQSIYAKLLGISFTLIAILITGLGAHLIINRRRVVGRK